MTASAHRIQLDARLHPAPPSVARHQPHPRGTHPRARAPARCSRARVRGPGARLARRAAAVPAAAALVERARRGAAADARRACRRRRPAAAAVRHGRVLSQRAAPEAHDAARSAAGAVRSLSRDPRPAAVRRGARAGAQGIRDAPARAAGYGLELQTEAGGGVPLARATVIIVSVPRRDWYARARTTPARSPARSLIDLREERLGGTRALEDARRLLHAALAACLEGRPLATRAVARSMVRKAAQS